MKSNVVEKFDQGSPLAKKKVRGEKKPTFDWVGGLKEFRDEYTSVELQEKASEWRVESALRKLAKNRKEAEEEPE